MLPVFRSVVATFYQFLDRGLQPNSREENMKRAAALLNESSFVCKVSTDMIFLLTFNANNQLEVISGGALCRLQIRCNINLHQPTVL